MAGRANQSFVVVFVEGETDFQFFTKLFKYYEQNSSSSIRRYKIVQMIEDWLLDDLEGLCKYLGLETNKSCSSDLPGKNGYEKMQNLFRRAHKVYLKGNAAKRTLDNLDFAKIRSKRRMRLEALERILNVKIQY